MTATPRLLPLLAAAALGCNANKQPPPPPPPSKVTVSQPARRDIAAYGEYTGFLKSQQIIGVTARVPAILVKIHFTEGSMVKKGDLLFELDHKEYELARVRANAMYEKAVAEREKAVIDWERAGGPKKNASVSEVEYRTVVAAKATAEAAEADAKAALAQADINLGYTTIRADIDGRIGESAEDEGNLVGAGGPTVLTRLIRVDPVDVYFDIPEAEAVEFERRAKAKGLATATANIPIEVAVGDELGYPHKGTINFKENRVDPGSGTARLRGTITNTERLLATGMYARVRVPKGDPKPRLLVPEAAVLADQQGRYVLVTKHDDAKNADVVERRKVTLARGGRLGDLVAVEDGLAPDDWVVYVGVQKARPGAAVLAERKPFFVPGDDPAKPAGDPAPPPKADAKPTP